MAVTGRAAALTAAVMLGVLPGTGDVRATPGLRVESQEQASPDQAAVPDADALRGQLSDRPHLTPTPQSAQEMGGLRPEPMAEPIGWATTAQKWANRLGQRFSFSCPPAGATNPVYGNGEYSTRSSICSAAVHAEKLTAIDGGTVTIRMIGQVDGSRKGMNRAGISSISYFGAASFVIE